MIPLVSRERGEWFKPLSREEKIWISIALAVGLFMAAVTLSWHVIDPRHQVPAETLEAAPGDWVERARRFAEQYEGRVVPEGVEIPLAGVQFSWIPGEIRLKAGVEYRLLVSSGDVLHGFSLIGDDGTVYNLTVMPGMVYVVNIKFDRPGVYEIRCNEFCGPGHQFMVGRIVVVEG